jgi:hypothetical protein
MTSLEFEMMICVCPPADIEQHIPLKLLEGSIPYRETCTYFHRSANPLLKSFISHIAVS